MKIIEISKITSHIIETDIEDWPIFRRNGPENWEWLIGDSWEQAYSDELKLEALFQEAVKDNWE